MVKEEYIKEEYIKDRNEAIISMDKEKILSFCEKYEIPTPDNEEVLWAGVHKVVCEVYLVYLLEEGDQPFEFKHFIKSYTWLIEHGYSPVYKDEEEEE